MSFFHITIKNLPAPIDHVTKCISGCQCFPANTDKCCEREELKHIHLHNYTGGDRTISPKMVYVFAQLVKVYISIWFIAERSWDPAKQTQLLEETQHLSFLLGCNGNPLAVYWAQLKCNQVSTWSLTLEAVCVEFVVSADTLLKVSMICCHHIYCRRDGISNQTDSALESQHKGLPWWQHWFSYSWTCLSPACLGYPQLPEERAMCLDRANKSLGSAAIHCS